MLTNAQLKQLIIDNLNSPFCFPVTLLLTKMIKRDNASLGSSYLNRIKDTNSNTEVTSLADFISKIDDTKFDLTVSTSNYSNNNIGVSITMKNFQITLNEQFKEDSGLSSLFGIGTHYIRFNLAYARDLDTALPLKITNIVLISI